MHLNLFHLSFCVHRGLRENENIAFINGWETSILLRKSGSGLKWNGKRNENTASVIPHTRVLVVYGEFFRFEKSITCFSWKRKIRIFYTTLLRFKLLFVYKHFRSIKINLHVKVIYWSNRCFFCSNVINGPFHCF